MNSSNHSSNNSTDRARVSPFPDVAQTAPPRQGPRPPQAPHIISNYSILSCNIILYYSKCYDYISLYHSIVHVYIILGYIILYLTWRKRHTRDPRFKALCRSSTNNSNSSNSNSNSNSNNNNKVLVI